MKHRLFFRMTAVLLLLFTVLAGTASAAEDTSGDLSVPVYGGKYRCGDYIYRVLPDGTAEIVEYVSMQPVTEIPAVLAGYPVSAIGDRAFSNQGTRYVTDDDYAVAIRDGIRRVRIPEGVVRIGDGAFEDCFNLIEIVLPQSLQTIGNSAFAECSRLTRAVLPDGLTSLGDYAFRGCYALTGINLPGSLSDIGANPFAACDHLTRIDIAADHPFLRYEDGLLTDELRMQLIVCTKKAWGKQLILREGIRTIGPSAFDSAPFEKITIPDSVTGIGSCAFRNCASLGSLDIPAGVTAIGDNPVDGCASLGTVRVDPGQSAFSVRGGALIDENEQRLIAYLPEGTPGKTPEAEEPVPEAEITYYGRAMRYITQDTWTYDSGPEAVDRYVVPDGIRVVGAFAFRGAAVTEIVLPDTVTELGCGAFADNDSLKLCRLPEGVTAIPDQCFTRCYSLQELALPGGTVSIGAYAFAHSGISGIAMPDTVESLGDYAFAYCMSMEEVRLSSRVTAIPRGAFSYSGIRAVGLSDSIAEIGSEAFSGCGALREITLPRGLTAIPDYCFFTSGLENIMIPEGVTYVGEYAFGGDGYNGTELASVRFPDSVMMIGNDAFWGADGLTEVFLPAGLAAVGSSAFEECYGLESVHFPDGVPLVGSRMFAGCPRLKEVTLPENLSVIGDSAFAYCTALEALRLPDHAMRIGNNPFAGCKALKPELSPDHPNLVIRGHMLFEREEGRLIAYLPETEETSCAVPDGTVSIGGSAFSGYTVLREIQLPDSLQIIGDYAFSGCELESIRFPEGLEEIGNGAFAGTCLREVSLPGSLRIIGADAFSNTPLIRADIPESVERIGDGAFGACTDLKQVVFAKSQVAPEGNPFAWSGPEIVLPPDHPTLELVGGNLYSRTGHVLIAHMTEEPVQDGTAEIAENALRHDGNLLLVLPESVEIINLCDYDFRIVDLSKIIVAPGSVSEAFFEAVSVYR